jgi:hypothetical protein
VKDASSASFGALSTCSSTVGPSQHTKSLLACVAAFGQVGAVVTALHTLLQKAGGFSGVQGRSGHAHPRRVVHCAGSFSAPAPFLDNPHGCFTILRGLTSAAKSLYFVDEAPTPCDYTEKRAAYYEKEAVDASNKVDKWKRQCFGAVGGLGCGEQTFDEFPLSFAGPCALPPLLRNIVNVQHSSNKVRTRFPTYASKQCNHASNILTCNLLKS